MRKTLPLICTLLLMTLAAGAVPAKRGLWRMLRLADGTTVRAQLAGDEFNRYYLDTSGTCYRRQAGGDIYSTQAEASPLLRQRARSRQVRGSRSYRMPGAARVGGAGQVFEGKKKGLVIMVNFANKQFEASHNRALYNRILNEEDFTSAEGFRGSVKDYFKAQSGGMFELDFDVVGPVTVSHNDSYYGADDDERAPWMIVEACQLVDSQVNFADYDWDGDGEVDQVFVLYAGLGEANGGDESTIWQHEYVLDDPYSYGSRLKLDGVYINTYACSSELMGTEFDSNDLATTTSIDGIGTFCHEFSHCLGFPDMYDTNNKNFGMGTWDLMDYGSYNADGFVPSGYTSYEKMVAGWLTPIELKEETHVRAQQPLSEGGEAYIIFNKAHPDEFYLLENRQQTGWDAEQYGAGLLILHVDYDEQVWYENTVNNTASRQRCTIFHADNNDDFTFAGLAGDPYPYADNNSLTNTSRPKASLYNANADGKKLMNVEITSISRNADGTMAFHFNPLDSGNTPEVSGDVLFQETFSNCSGKGGNDGLWSGNIASAAFAPDNSGWETTLDVAYGAQQCARFGTSKKYGRAQSPVISIDGNAVLSFSAAPWGNENCTLIVTTDADDRVDIDEVEFPLTSGEWTEFTTRLTGTGSVRLVFSPTKNRFFLNEVTVSRPVDNGIEAISAASSSADTRIFSLDGRYLGTNFKSLSPGIYIIGGRKVIK